MEAKIIKVDKQNIDPEVMRQAGSIIRMGGLVAFPTETVYGLGADARQKDAAARIYSRRCGPSSVRYRKRLCGWPRRSGLAR